jgi:hypothetical protein
MQSVLHPVIGPEKVVHDLSGRVAVVTGGAFGIGRVEFHRPRYEDLDINIKPVLRLREHSSNRMRV